MTKLDVEQSVFWAELIVWQIVGFYFMLREYIRNHNK